MADLTAQRTLVKSPPELWTELSEVERLAKHLGELGEITITKVEPESTVAWEGEQISGTVALEQSGWGTKVTLTATLPEPDPPAEPEPDVAAADPEPTVGEPEAPMGEPAPPESEPTAGEPEAVVAEPESEPEAAQPAMEEPERRSRMGFLARWLFRRRQPDPQPVAVEPEPEEPEPAAAVPEPVAAMPEPEPVAAQPEPVAAEPAPEIEPAPVDAAPPAAERVQAILDGTLDALGQAHHRPFSRG